MLSTWLILKIIGQKIDNKKILSFGIKSYQSIWTVRNQCSDLKLDKIEFMIKYIIKHKEIIYTGKTKIDQEYIQSWTYRYLK